MWFLGDILAKTKIVEQYMYKIIADERNVAKILETADKNTESFVT